MTNKKYINTFVRGPRPDGNLIKNNSAGNKKEHKNTRLEILTETMLFPFLTFSSKVPLIGNSGAFWSDCYLGVSAVADAAEIIYRSRAGKSTGEDASKPYSCFEKHVFYDAPKFLWGKVFGGGEK